MSVFALKLFAMVSMLADHLGSLLYELGAISFQTGVYFHTLGRFAFPLYCFLLGEGFRHSQDRPLKLRDHLFFLLLLAAVSEPLFDYFSAGELSGRTGQSVVFTLVLGYAGLWLIHSFTGVLWKQVLAAGTVILSGFLLGTNYGAAGVALVLICYGCQSLAGEKPWYLRLPAWLLALALYYALYNWIRSGLGGMTNLWGQIKAMGVYGLPHLLLVPILTAYDGSLGLRSKTLHRVYQWFYPAHLAILCLLKLLLRF